jgi:hypothetical protein
MRDFRDAKAMARTLRAALAAKGLRITISQSLELIAEAFGVADWNTLAAAIWAQAHRPRESTSPPLPPNAPPLPPTAESGPGAPGPIFSRALELTLSRALAHANQRMHEYATLEHLLLALIDDVDAWAVMEGCSVDLDLLEKKLAGYVDNELKGLVIDGGDRSRPSKGFQRVLHRAVVQVQSSGRIKVTGANVLVEIFSERESHAAWFLQEQGMTRYDAVNFIVEQGVVRQSFTHGRTKPVVVTKVKRRTAAPMDGKTVKNANRPPSGRPR